MAKYESWTIAKLIKQIDDQVIILPAMQRNFVWPEEKICSLFDSILRDYPIGTFLFWDVDKNSFNDYVFNKFIKEYDEKNGKMQRGERAEVVDKSDYYAVLDGQQRITSLYIGAAGKYITRYKPKKGSNESGIREKYLCINIINMPGPDEPYEFAFREACDIDRLVEEECEDGNTVKKYWIRVSYVWSAETDPTELALKPVSLAEDYPDIFTPLMIKFSAGLLVGLRNSIVEKENVSFYPADDMSLSQVVDIFVRVNSGGQKLSASDLMLSVATGEEEDVDFQVKMKEAIDTINSATSQSETAYVADNETLLTAGLMFTGAENLSLQKKENYSKETISKILKNWDDIIEALCSASIYIEYLGFNGKKLTSKNLLLPIAYYFYKNHLKSTHKDGTSERARRDRVFIRQWMLRAMINSVFSDATRTTLLRIRDVIKLSNAKYFPLDELMNASIRKSLFVDDNQIEDILDYKYGDARIVPILTEIAKDYDGKRYDVDHIWPRAILMNRRELTKRLPSMSEVERDRYRDACNYLSNLELLTPTANMEKGDKPYDQWVQRVHPSSSESYYTNNCIPVGVPYELNSFLDFTSKRRELLKSKLKETFPESFNKIVEAHQLEENTD